ncbi:SDR family oxidoreductase [bacterium]|nr:SDR family oxidoreductase [bacterium]
MKHYLISGAGSGIGRAIAVKLAQNGHAVILCGRDIAKLQATLKDLPEPARHQVLAVDVRSPASLNSAIQSFPKITLDGIIANAGVGGKNTFGINDRWDEIISTNLTGTYQFVNSFLPFLRKSPSEFKHVIITSSILARLGVAGYSAYCASKSGLLGLMRSWAVEWAPEKILVNAICPGWVNTKMAHDGIQGIADAVGITKNEAMAMAMKPVPLGKMTEPEEVADLIDYLLQQKSITGQALDINNGAIMNS